MLLENSWEIHKLDQRRTAKPLQIVWKINRMKGDAYQHQSTLVWMNTCP